MRLFIFSTGLLIFVLLFSRPELLAQRQLLLVRGDKILHHYITGETFKTKLRGDRKEHWGFIVEINEFSVITSQDTFLISDVSKVLLNGKPIVNKVGKLLVTVGAALVIIDQFNWTVIQGHDPKMDASVWIPATALVSAGIPMLFFQKDWRKIRRGTRLISVDSNSILYIRD